MKIFILCLIFLQINASSLIPLKTKQLLVVTTSNFNSPTATLQAYERDDKTWTKVFDPIKVNLGTNGLAWGIGERTLLAKENEPLKYEGDKKAPAGLFTLNSFFGYDNNNFNFPYAKLSKDDICVDDSSSQDYNSLINTHSPHHFKSFEYMKRDDDLYELGIVVGHNLEAKKQRGSCIFIHIQRAENSSTSGCTSMSKTELLKLMNWLDYVKAPLLLQVPKTHLKEWF